MTHHCDLADDYIVLYALDDLRGARREYVEGHIAGCPECQRGLAEFQKVTQLLRESSRTIEDDASHRAAIVDEIGRRAAAHHQRRKFHLWQPVLVAGLLLALSVVFLAPQVSRADFPLGRVIGILTEPANDVTRVISGSQEPPGVPSHTPETLRYDVAELPFQPVAPAQLPLGLERVGQTWPYPRDVVSRYEGAANLTVELIQTPIADSDLAISPTIETITILGTVVMQQTSPEPGAVAALYWVRDGFVFQLSPLRAPYGGLLAEDAYLIVRSLIRAQDAMP